VTGVQLRGAFLIRVMATSCCGCMGYCSGLLVTHQVYPHEGPEHPVCPPQASMVGTLGCLA